MIKILRGDDTAANGHTLSMRLPVIDIERGYTLTFVLDGIVTELGDVTSGTFEWNYTSEQTSGMCYGVHLASLILSNGELRQTVSNTIPVVVTDSVDEAYGTDSTVNANVVLNGVIPHINIDALTTANNVGDVKAKFNALLAILKSIAG